MQHLSTLHHRATRNLLSVKQLCCFKHTSYAWLKGFNKVQLSAGESTPIMQVRLHKLWCCDVTHSDARHRKLFKATSVICLTLLMVNAYIYCAVCMFENAQIFQLSCAASSATQYGCMYLFICSVASQFSFHSFFTLAFQQLLTHPRVRGHRRLVLFTSCALFQFTAFVKTDVYLGSNLSKGHR